MRPLILLIAVPLYAQITVDTVAGGKILSGVSAQNVSLETLAGTAWDPSGNVVFCDLTNDVIRRIDATGIIETIAGTGVTGFAGDGGSAASALLNRPEYPRYDSAGNLYFFDAGNYRIRRVDTHGIITTVAGNGMRYQKGGNLTGPATSLSLGDVVDLAPDSSGNLYFIEDAADLVLRLTPDGTVSIFAGCLGQACPSGSNGDGAPANQASLDAAIAIALTPDGSVYILEGSLSSPIRRVSPSGIISTFITLTPNRNPSEFVRYLTADSQSNLYVVLDQGIVRIRPDGTLTTIAATQTAVFEPMYLSADAQGDIAFVDMPGTPPANFEVREVTSQQSLKTLAGSAPQSAPDGTPLLDAWFLRPNSIAFDHNGNLYIVDSQACLIRKIDTSGVLSTFAGTGACGNSAPSGSAKTANLIGPVSIAVDSQNRVWAVDGYLNLYSIAQDGTISLYPSKAPVTGGSGQLAIDAKDRVYVMGAASLARILPDGTMQTIIAPPSGPGGPGVSLMGLGVDPSGNVYFHNNFNIYRVNDDGSYEAVYDLASQQAGSWPFGVNAAGVVWSGDCFTNSATSGCLGTLGGFAGDGGLAENARFSPVQSIFAPNGDLYMIDGNRIRKLTFPQTPPPAPVISAGGIVNAVSYTGGTVAPGELVSIFGSNFGSTTLQTNAAVNNSIPLQLGRTKVLFNNGVYNYYAPITALSPNQINVIVPQYLDPDVPTQILVQVDDAVSVPVSIPIVPAAPGLAAADSSGSGPGAILNQDNSVNSSANPAVPGSVISLFGTGIGLASPELDDGALAISTPYPVAQNTVSATIGGETAQVLYAGDAPNFPNGVSQINVQIPAGLPPGNAVVSVTIGGVSTTQRVTVAIK